MSLDILQSVEIIETMENYLERVRPRVEIRDQLDISYKIENQSIIIFEVRPRWDNQAVKHESPIAKTTYVHAKKFWKIFWMRADLRWHGYEPKPHVKTLEKFLEIVTEDKYGCFWG